MRRADQLRGSAVSSVAAAAAATSAERGPAEEPGDRRGGGHAGKDRGRARPGPAAALPSVHAQQPARRARRARTSSSTPTTRSTGIRGAREALARARHEDKPIFLSIGYAACHWCHVMERESFEDAPTAAELNRDFVPIKVDREERPDLDQVYMAAVQAMTGSGGWPMSVFLTPDGRPFYGGTYFPDTPRHGLPSFRQVLAGVARA